jgi:hypothetical protein
LRIDRLPAATSRGKLVRHDRSQFDDRVAVFALPASGPNDYSGRVQGELWRIEEEHLTDLRLERVDA